MSRSKQKILIIDDTPMNLMMLEEALANLECELLFAKSGESGISTAKEIKPDLALLDTVMPGMDGFETLKELKAIGGLEKMPVIFLTAVDDGESKLRAFESGAVDYIAKPFDAAEVAARVKTHLELARLASSLDFLLKMTAHEFIIPLSIIDTSLQMHRMEYGDSEYLNSVLSASKTLYGVYSNMAYFLATKAEGSGPQEIFLAEFIKKRADYLASVAESYGTAYEIDEITGGMVISFNAQKLERVVDNLLSNAAKHSVAGGSVKIRVFSEGGCAAFEVENRCRRIENFPKIFEAFYQGRSGAAGLGLGLYIVLKICEEHGAQIGARQENGNVFFKVLFEGRVDEDIAARR